MESVGYIGFSLRLQDYSIEIPQSMKNSNGDVSAAVTVVEITDPTAAGENIEVIEQDVIQLQSNPLHVLRVNVRLGRGLVVYQSTNLPVRTRTRVSSGLIAFVTFGPQAEGTINGVGIRPDLIVTGEPDIEGEFVVGAGYESVAVFLPPDLLQKHLEIRQRADELNLPHGIEVLRSSPSSARNLFQWGKRLTEVASQQRELFDDHANSRATAQIELLELVLDALRSSEEHKPTRSDRTMQTHSRIVQVAEDYATTHSKDRPSVTDLCEVADVSERTLQYAFQNVMGMTPIAYLTRLRLHRVREALRKAVRGSTTVSAVALSWGFWHFGDFSRSYKNCFGESPSETMNQGDYKT